MSNKELITRALDELYTHKDLDAIDRYFAAEYRQHSARVAEGGLRAVLADAPVPIGYQLIRILGDGDFIATHGVYTGVGPDPLVAFDIFRVADGKVVEHWDAHMTQSAPNPSGRTLTDGATEVTRPTQTEATRALARSFIETAFVGANFSASSQFPVAGNYLAADYQQHNPNVGDGMPAFTEAMAGLAAAGITVAYHAVRKIVAEGEFALIVSDAELGGRAAVWDLIRVDGDHIVEHWDIVQPIPDGIDYF